MFKDAKARGASRRLGYELTPAEPPEDQNKRRKHEGHDKGDGSGPIGRPRGPVTPDHRGQRDESLEGLTSVNRRIALEKAIPFRDTLYSIS